MFYSDFSKIPAQSLNSPKNFPFLHGLPIIPLYGYDNVEEADKDCSYSKFLYSNALKAIQREVEEECDKLEYAGSCMYHTYPDKVHLQMISATIYDRVKDLSLEPEIIEISSLLEHRCQGDNCPPPKKHCIDKHCSSCQGQNCSPREPIPDYGPDRKPNWLKNLIDVMLYNEMNTRRRRYRGRNSWF